MAVPKLYTYYVETFSNHQASGFLVPYFGFPLNMYSLWRCAVEVEVLEVDHDPLVLERLELVGALLHVALGVQVHRRTEGPVLRRRRRRRDVTLITGCEVKKYHIISLGLCEGAITFRPRPLKLHFCIICHVT